MWQAVDDLTYQQRVHIERDNGTTETTFIASWLDQLIGMVKPSGEMSSGGSSGGKPESRPPLSLDAFALIFEMERYTESPNLAAGMRAIAQTLDRYRDEDGQDAFASTVTAWTARIRVLAGVETIKTRPLSIPCPSCQQLWIWDLRDDETIRTYAVFATFRDGDVESFGCLVCKTEWKRGDDLDALVDWRLGR